MSDQYQKALDYSTSHFLCHDGISCDEAYNQLNAAIDNDDRLPRNLAVWEPFESWELDAVLDEINKMADQLCSYYAPDEQSSVKKRLLIVEENDQHIATIANFDHQDLEIVHIKYDSDFQEPDDMIDIQQSNGSVAKAYGHIHCIDMESDRSLNVNDVFDAVKLHHT